MTSRVVSWAPDQRGLFHALEDPYAVKKRSLCGLRVEIDDRLITTDESDLRKCRSCLEKLGGGR